MVQLLTWLDVLDYNLIFGTLKDGFLEINSLALNNCFSYRNVFQNGVNTLSKMVLKTRFLFCFVCHKSQNVMSKSRMCLCSHSRNVAVDKLDLSGSRIVGVA